MLCVVALTLGVDGAGVQLVIKVMRPRGHIPLDLLMDKKDQQDAAMAKEAGQTSMIMGKNGLFYRLPQALSTAVA